MSRSAISTKYGAGPEPTRASPPDTSVGATLKLAWPLLFANLAMVGNSTIDAVMAGRLSADDMAGVAVAGSIYVTVFVAFVGVLQALSPIAGHHYGAQRWRAIGDDLQQAMWLAALLSLLALPAVLATGMWNRIAGLDGPVAGITTGYLHAAALGLPAALATRVFIALNAAVSRPKVTMLVNLTLLGLKAPLNAVFMFGWGPWDAMGGAGAGMATAVLAWLALAMSYAIWRFDSYYDRMRSGAVNGPHWASLRDLLKLGVPIGVTMLFEVSSFTFMAVLIARLGAVPVAGHQIVANVVALLFMVPLSLGIASSVLVAQSLGYGSRELARAAVRHAFNLSLAAAAMAALALWIFRDGIVALYTRDAAVAQTALALLGLAAVFHLFDATQGVATFVLRGYRQTFWPMVIYGVALWALGLGGGAWIAFNDTPLGPPRGVAGFWQAATVALGLAAVLMAWLVRRELRRPA